MKVGFLLLAVLVTLSQEINDNKETRDDHEDTGQKENQDGVIDYRNELSNEEMRDDLEGQEENQDGVIDYRNELSNEETRDDHEGQEEKQDGKEQIKNNEYHKQNIIEPEEAKFKKGAELVSNLRFEDKARGYEMLKEAAAMGNSKAKYLLAYGYLYGNVLQRNFTKSFELFTELANKGLSSGQQGLGFMYSTGIGTNSSQAKAILYYTFGALGGDPHAQMSMGYRTLHGVATSKSCETSLSYYRKVASKVADESSVFAGGHSVQKIRLQDDEDEPSTVFAGVTEDELEHYREVFADAGAQLSLGLYYLFGLGGVERNLPQALELLLRADSPAANALIGRIYAEGSPPDIPQNNETAIKYFKKAIDLKSGEGYTGLGIMYFKGMGVERDYSTAMEYFQKAADKGSHEANLYIGLGYLFGLGKVKNPSRALSSLKASAQGGHILAIYYLAEIYAKGLTGRRNCDQAVELYKAVSERGKWSKLLREAHKTYLSGDIDSALIMYLHLAEIGIEVAQSNAAYIINEGETDMIDKNDSLKIALILWSRSATQGYGVARVKLGDCYYYGYGTEPNMELAVEQYRMASDKMAISQAMFNLGYMYEQGIGLQQDYHLAKRYYDLAAQTSTEAAVPVNLALMKLSIHFYYQYILEYISSYEELDNLLYILHSSLGEQWDIYLTALLCIVLAIVIRWHRR